jgi:hypothetical protein
MDNWSNPTHATFWHNGKCSSKSTSRPVVDDISSTTGRIISISFEDGGLTSFEVTAWHVDDFYIRPVHILPIS